MKTTITISTLALGALLMSFTLPTEKRIKMAGKQYNCLELPSIQWKNLEVDLGEIEHNKPVTIEFEFANTGKVAVVISHVQAGCGCTATNYNKAPILPGETAKIGATFNAATIGSFRKSITVTTNAEESPRELVFKGKVI